MDRQEIDQAIARSRKELDRIIDEVSENWREAVSLVSDNVDDDAIIIYVEEVFRQILTRLVTQVLGLKGSHQVKPYNSSVEDLKGALK